MEKVILNAEIREETGKSKVKELRKTDLIPAVVYKKKDSVNIKIQRSDLFQVLHTDAGENVLITLKVKNDRKKERTCLIKEIQRNPVKDNIIHVDLNEISLTEKIKVKVPVHSHGDPEGVIKEEGVLEHVMWEIEIECLPTDIPEKIEVEVASMKIGDTVYIKDLVLPAGVKALNDAELAVLTVKPPAKEEAAEEVSEGEAEEPEVIAKGKKEAEEEEAAGEEEKPKKEAKEAPPREEKKKG